MLTRKPRVGDRVSYTYRDGKTEQGTVTRLDGRLCHWTPDGKDSSLFIWGFEHRGEKDGNVVDGVLLNNCFSEV